MRALLSKRSLLQFLIFIVLVVVVKMIAGALGYDISGVLSLIIALGGSTLVWWTIEASKQNKADGSDA